ncbi:peptide deformylase [Streptococcus pluranimalium]|uniref:Peptide deformylase n=1 Tax=Streptococcus pluranimalium TaxID=82348 RepID=A0A345VMP1_9STRE|nr:peptide deformylase [Streptococcus pluranimalium]AXJ13993.1 Peptide deformylase [Streptococcus pluranimalium]MDY3041436.1 peptide deformylase [Streptococcus pluranimalium]
MSPIEKITKAAHLIDMNDIIREGHPTLRLKAEETSLPLSDQDIILGEKMMQFLKNSQDPVMAEKLGLRGGVGLAAPQLNISKRIIAVLVPNPEDEEGNQPEEAYSLQEIMYNPKIISHSVQQAALADGEGCLSVDRVVEGYVPRHSRITVEYFDKDGHKQKLKLKGYNAIVVQHEIDHLNGVLFYDRINIAEPFKIEEGVIILD